MEYSHSKTQKQHYNGRAYPELVPTPVDEHERTYYAALKLVARIDEDLSKGIRHYRTKAGLLLTTLDEVIRAILDNDLLLDEGSRPGESVWLATQELAA